MAERVDEDEIERFLRAWFGVRQVIQAANFNHFHKAALSASQFMTLNLLPVNGDGLSMGELARQMNLKPATIAKTVDSLEARKLISRMKSPADGRLVLIQITNQGRKFQNAAAGHFRKHIRNLFLGVPAKDRAGLITGLEKLLRSATEMKLIPNEAISGRAGDAPPARRSSRRVQKR